MSENEILLVLREILKWVKFIGWRYVKDVLIDVLDTDTAKLVYHHSDGKTLKEIAELVGISRESVRYYWKKWQRLGIVDTVRVRGGIRCVRLFDLEELGIPIPSINEVKKMREEK